MAREQARIDVVAATGGADDDGDLPALVELSRPIPGAGVRQASHGQDRDQRKKFVHGASGHHRRVHRGACCAQAIPTLEQLVLPAGDLWQVRQPSVHSRQAGSGGADGLALMGAAGLGAGVTFRSVAIATAGNVVVTATSTQILASRVMAAMVPSPHHPVEQP